MAHASGLNGAGARRCSNVGMNTFAPLFLSHGSPMTALEPREAGAFMQHLGATIRQQQGAPKAVLVISAHSLTREPALLAAAQHQAVYDFGGFDPRLNQLLYNAPGAPALAPRVARLLQAAGLPVHTLNQGGLDHGIWTPLRFMFPQADVPVLPLAWPPQWTPQQLFTLGQALAPLADEGVLIIGSGSITHNLQRVFAGGGLHPADGPATPESTAFRDWFAQQGAQAHWPQLLDYRAQAPHAVLMHPSDEHLLPFFVAAGAGGHHPALRVHSSLVFGELGMDAYAFGSGAATLQTSLQTALQ
jgi:4,5-DOPA dioxygenase extradiol